jgi:fatty acid-binding protein DegV
MDKITDLLKTNHHVVYFPVSSGLSTQFSNGKLMEEEFGDKLVVVKTASAVAVNK